MNTDERGNMDPIASIVVLHLEDSDLDAEFVKVRLEKAGLPVVVERVGDRKAFVAHLRGKQYDLILSDYQVPTFEGLAALDLALEHQPDTPFIFVSGAMGEELAVETLKRGATDYVLKDRLTRLPAAVDRALAEAKERVERGRAEEELAERELRYRLVADAANDAIWDWNLVTDQIMWNEGVRTRFGYSAEDVSPDASWWVEHIHPKDVEFVIRDICEHIDRGPDQWQAEYRFRRADGTYAFVFDRGRVMRDATGKPLRMVGSMFDLTERRRAEEERERLLAATEQARDEAESANLMKDEFLATLSHELRTPLNAIVGWTRILRSTKANADDISEGLDVIDRNARAQVQLIEDLLDISRIVSGKLTIDVQRVQLQEIIEAALASATPAATARDIRITTLFEPLADPVSGDPNRLQQVVWNLVSNAVKFTPRGGEVQVLLERVESHVQIRVVDTGQGIKPEFLPHVFDRFRQADGSTTRRYSGLGLGLSIVKQLVEMHGGSVRAESPGEGQGATFAVLLPVTVAHPKRPEKGHQTKHRRDGKRNDPCGGNDLGGLKVLVVDDEPDARVLMKRVLGDCGAEVEVAGSAGEALALVESFRPEVLISDIGMPDQDGYDLIRQTRSLLSAKELPAAALTAFARSEDRTRAMRAGFQMHVAKPFDPEELVAVVAALGGKA